MTTTISPTSYITADDLLTLDLAPLRLDSPCPGPSKQPLSPAPQPAPAPSPPAQPRPRRSSRSRSRVRHHQAVSFCPTVEQFACAPDGERDDALVQAHMAYQAHARRPLPRLAVKTYALDGINWGAAWGKVSHTLASSIQASLSPNSHSGYPGGVCQYAPRHSEWESEREEVWNGRSARQYEEDVALAEEDKKGGVKIKLPSLTRKRPSRSGSCPGARGILKRGCSRDDNLPSEDDDALPELSRWPSSPPVSELSSSPTDMLALSPPPRSPSTSHTGTSLPLSSCCARCHKATDYGLTALAAYTERFSKGATRLREAEQRRQADEAGTDVSATNNSRATPTPADRAAATVADDDVAAPAPFAKGRKVVVDELSSHKRDQRVEHRASQAELKRGFCEAKEEVLGLVGMEERDGEPTPTASSESDDDPTPPSTASPLSSPKLELADRVPELPTPPPAFELTAEATAARPTPKVRSSADDIIPQPVARPAPPPQKRKFSLGSLVFGAGVGMGEAGKAGKGF